MASNVPMGVNPMKSRFFVALLFVVVLAGAMAISQAQSGKWESSLSESSYRKAREVLDAGQKALGVKGTQPGLDDVSFTVTGKLYARNQSPQAEGTDPLPLTAQYTFDLARNRLYWHAETFFPGGFPVNNTVIYKGDQGQLILPIQRTVGPIPPPGNRNLLLYRVPQAVLVQAEERANTLRWLGEATYEGKKQNVIAYVTPAGAQMALYFDATTNLLTKSESLGTDPVAGDAVTESIIAGWQTVEGVRFPTGQILKTAGEMAQDYRYSEIKVNRRPADAEFEPPRDYAAAPPPPATQLRVNELSKGVWLLEGLGGGFYAPLVVEFRDHVMVIEPAFSDSTTRTVLDKVKELAPGKSVRYVVPTHHHSDHSGGTRGYIAEGATLVTTPGNAGYFQRMAAARFTMPPDSLQKNPRALSLETMQNKKRVFTDGAQTVELYDIGPNSHAREMVVAWLPKERILYCGDLVNRNPDNSMTPAIQATVDFATALDRLALPVERIVDTHSRVNTMADLRQSLELGRNGGQRAGTQ
jgi:glyoxylase-like metal-dependent hydrolase (beta-lactamase superfamily II)